jgi:phospholipid transport system substrate-binding protein
MARRSVGIYWKQRNPEEHKEFVSLFTDLLQNTYIRKIERYKDEHVEYGEEKTDGPYSTVKTDIVSTKDQRIPVEYRLLKTGERWEVYDIIIEGVSLVNNYRGQFAQIIRSSSYEELVKRLRKKTVKEPS